MRIISGKYKGKKLDGFAIIGTRPTMDRVKESLFAILQNNINDSICLDLFAGSGSLGIEALSNGASFAYLNDSGKVYNILKNNLKDLTDYKLLNLDYLKALKYFKENNITFDIIFLDPPYDKHYINSCLTYIENNNLLKPNGLIVCEYITEVIKSNFPCIKDKKYGDKYIKIYKNTLPS